MKSEEVFLRRTAVRRSSVFNSVTWSPDNRWVAAAASDGCIWLFDRDSGERRRLEGHTGPVYSVVWSADGKWLASGSEDETVRVWEVATRKLARVLEGHTSPVLSVAWSADGKRLASGSMDSTVRVWEVMTGKPARVLEGHTDSVLSVSWSADGKWLASGSIDSTVRVWEAATRKAAGVLEGHSDAVLGVAWSADGKWLASGSMDNTVRLWEVTTQKLAGVLAGHTHWVASVAWSADGKWLASGSSDSTVRVWEVGTGKVARVLEGHTNRVASVAWSADGKWLASGSCDKKVRVWEVETGRPARVLEGPTDWVPSVAWSADGKWLASGSDDKTVRVWEMATGKVARVLEGHTSLVLALAWSGDGSLLASMSEDCEVRLWRAEDGVLLAVLGGLPYHNAPGELAFVSRLPQAFVFGPGLALVDGWRPAIAAVKAAEQIVSAKVAFVGESNIGKSCLALRLAKDEYRDLPTTHGMQIWPLAPQALDPAAESPEGESREVVLWDLGGQRYYQLVHQLFLPDTLVALILFDPTRGEQNFEEVEDWRRRLKQAGSGMRTLLVRSKADLGGEPDVLRTRQLMKTHPFDGYLEVSAKEKTGVAELGKRILELIDWAGLAKVSRTEEFQAIHEQIADARQKEKVVLFERDLMRQLERAGRPVTKAEADAVAGQLSRQGQLVDLRSASGERVLVLRVDVVDQYAGSLILLARSHPRGVPVLEHRSLGLLKQFPGIKETDRVRGEEERVVLESVAELFVARGLAVQHAGLLILPTEFPNECAPDIAEVPHRKPLYYDFDGPVDNIWASLAANLAVSGEFGSVRLWANRAEYEQTGRGVFGLYLREIRRGCGHLDVYFSDETEEARRDLFISYVDSHLREHGVRLAERLGITCSCGQVLEEKWFRKAFARQESDLRCPDCGATYPVLGGAEAARRDRPGLERELRALKTKVEERAKSAAEESKRNMERGAKQAAPHAEEPYRVLHLSDLHFTGTEGVWRLLQPLSLDLKQSLKAEKLDYVVVSGDFAEKCQDQGFDLAEEFLKALIHEFDLSADRLILCPGNHDLDRKLTVYDYKEDWPPDYSDREAVKLSDGGFLVRNRVLYPRRFERFGKLYHNLLQRPYPSNHDEQGVLFWYPETGIEFLTLNSAWEIDGRFLDRASLNLDAVGKALMESRKNKARLRIVVWHHPVRAERQVANQQAINNLAKAGYHMCLHGDIHEETAEVVGWLDPRRRFHVVGTGSFGQGCENTPRLYSLLEIDRDFERVVVRLRSQRKTGDAFGPHAVVGTGDPDRSTARYEIKINKEGL